jgi:DNA-directed RNA polymerase specialized sigma24 family protein
MRKNWDFNKEEFDRLLDWLAPDREQAAQKYEEIRSRIIKMLLWRGCTFAEEIADEVINRVIRKLSELVGKYEGDPALYFYSVAKKVHLEELRRRLAYAPLGQYDLQRDAQGEPDDRQDFHDCLDACLKLLSQTNRELILQYFNKEKQAKIDFRKVLAEQSGISLDTLRTRVHRIRLKLRDCINDCLKQKSPEDI